MKVTAICISSQFSGGEIYLLELMSALQRKGHTVEIIGSTNVAFDISAELHQVPLRTMRLGPKLGRKTAISVAARIPVTLIKLRRVVSQADPDIVILQYKLEQILWCLLAIQANTVAIEHGPVPPAVLRSRIVGHLYRKTMKRSVARFSASAAAQRSLAGVGIESTILVPGVDSVRVENALRRAGETRLSYLQLLGTKKFVVYAGRLTRNKGIYELLELAEANQHLGLVIAGRGSEECAVRRASELHKNIVYIGREPDPLPLIAAADCGMLLTSDPGEGRPLFAIECLAVGTPIIGAADSPALLDLAREFPGDSISLVKAADRDQIARELDRVQPKSPTVMRSWDDIACRFLDALPTPRR